VLKLDQYVTDNFPTVSRTRPQLFAVNLAKVDLQPDSSAPRSGRGGRRFKSCHSDQLS